MITKTIDYFEWLCDIILGDVYENWKRPLLYQLAEMDFYSLIPNDDNRCTDGTDLREQFIDDWGGQQALPVGQCSVLEMLIALSFRLEFETSQSKWEKTPQEWFWILIDNLGLTGVESHSIIIENVTLFLERGYKSNGEGGLFPLKNARIDQKKVEIWYQMSAFMLENYPI